MIVGLAVALAASTAHAHLFDGPAPPDRLVHRYEIECRGLMGSVTIEERFNRSQPSLTVAIRSFTPFGASSPAESTPELDRVFARMVRIQRVEWLCDRSRALLFIEYAERQSVERGYGQPVTSGRAHLHLDAQGLRPEAQRTGVSPAR